jgi:hypothetical protein
LQGHSKTEKRLTLLDHCMIISRSIRSISLQRSFKSISLPPIALTPQRLPYSTRNQNSRMSTEFESEKARIAELAEAIRQLKVDGKPCDVELKEMLDLKKKVGQSTGSGKKDSGKGKIQLKTPKVDKRNTCQ